MSLQAVIKKKAKLLTIMRDAGTSTVNGFRVANSPTTISQSIYLQPMSLKELRNMPEGQNTMAWYNAWSVDAFYDRDKIMDGGVTYTVQRAAQRPEGGFYKAQAVKVDDAP